METIPGWVPFDPEKTPDIYADAVNIDGGYYGWTILFGRQHLEGSRAAATVRMSPQMLKVFYLLLQKQLREYEHQVGVIPLPKEMADKLGIETTVV